MVISVEHDATPPLLEPAMGVEAELQPIDVGFEELEPGSTVELIDEDDDCNLPSTSSSSTPSATQKLTCVVACAACSRNVRSINH